MGMTKYFWKVKTAWYLRKNFVRIGHRLGILPVTDRWGCYTPNYYVPSCAWVSKEMWERLREYQEPIPLTPEDRELEQQFVQGKIASLKGTRIWNEVFRRMKLSGYENPTTAWTFNALVRIVDEDKESVTDYVRMVALFGGNKQAEPAIVRWTWTDVYVRRPLYCILAWVRTHFAKLTWRPE